MNNDSNGYQLEVSKNASPQTIQWDLVLTAGQSGSFNSLTDATNPGFSWTYSTPPPPPPPGFSAPSEPASPSPANWIQVTDTHTQFSNNDGTWTYRLCATVNGTLCQTNPPSPRGKVGDPIIKNK